MAFDRSRPDPALLAGIPFGEDWLALTDPADRGVADPLDVGDRLALYRLLVERCNPRGALGACDQLSPFWGYASQLAWQQRSGRLSGAGRESPPRAGPGPATKDPGAPEASESPPRAGPGPATKDPGAPEASESPPRAGPGPATKDPGAPEASESIAPASWWGACNHALSVVPYAAAMQLGAVPSLRFEHAGAAMAPVAPAHARSVQRWREAITAMCALAPGDDIEAVRFAVWRAHLESIETAVRLHRPAFEAMPAAERRFARGWVRMVDLLGASATRTDLGRLAGGDGSLPPRVLTGDDGAALADLTRHQRSTVRRVFALGDRPTWRWSIEIRAWRRMMRTRAARDESEAIIAALLGRARDDWPVRLRALRYLVEREAS